ncbi:GAF domain-containing protein [Actinomadura fulvescens]|uniref:GAF domain-containing protein n=1 Tax=Actinomadura fulvescens TaxID=46160 RepID=A0ABN3Q4G0_9ACTN
MDRHERAWQRVQEHAAGRQVSVDVVYAAAAQTVGADGYAVALVSGPGMRTLVAASDRIAELIEDVQLSSGEGPCTDAYTGLAPVIVPDVQAAADRWPGFVPAVAPVGVRALFAFPMQLGGVRVGAADLYRRRPGPLTPAQLADARAFADIAAQVAFRQHPDPKTLAALAADRPPHGYPPVVHQAAGMLAAQLDLNIAEAISRLRAYSYLHDNPSPGWPARSWTASPRWTSTTATIPAMTRAIHEPDPFPRCGARAGCVTGSGCLFPLGACDGYAAVVQENLGTADSGPECMGRTL